MGRMTEELMAAVQRLETALQEKASGKIGQHLKREPEDCQHDANGGYGELAGSTVAAACHGRVSPDGAAVVGAVWAQGADGGTAERAGGHARTHQVSPGAIEEYYCRMMMKWALMSRAWRALSLTPLRDGRVPLQGPHGRLRGYGAGEDRSVRAPIVLELG